jgi:hypothetical protein
MEALLTRVIIAPSDTSSAATVYHQNFPEIRAEGSSAKDAAAQLVNKLTRALDTALTDARRTPVTEAIADVRAFVEKGD